MSDLVWSDSTEQADAIRRGEVSATELTWEYLSRIDRFDPILRAYVSVDSDGALEAAISTTLAVSAAS